MTMGTLGTAAGFTSDTSPLPDDLLGGEYPRVPGSGTLVSGQNLLRGALLGQITTGGKYTLSLAASEDGSQTPVAILAADVNATSADVANAPMYFTGEFNQRKVIFGTGHTAASVKVALRDRGIFLQNTVPAAATS